MKKTIETDFIGECWRPKEDKQTIGIVMAVALFILMISIIIGIIGMTCDHISKLNKRITELEIDIARTEQRIIKHTAQTHYIPLPTVYVEMPKFADLPDVPGTFKSWMDFRKITDRNSPQLSLQQLAHTNSKGFRVFNNRYMVALGTFYGKYIGQTFEITLTTGSKIKVVLGDYKANKDTDSKHQYGTHNKDIIEFIVDARKLQPGLGDLSSMGLQGGIKSIRED